jgi:hypothetical protein
LSIPRRALKATPTSAFITAGGAVEPVIDWNASESSAELKVAEYTIDDRRYLRARVLEQNGVSDEPFYTPGKKPPPPKYYRPETTERLWDVRKDHVRWSGIDPIPWTV